MYYKRIEIKSEADLPREKGIYIAKEKDLDQPVFLKYKDIFDQILLWLEVDWYLQPVEEELYPKEFVEWYVTEGQFEYRFGVGQVPSPLAEAFDFWQTNIKDK
jgi:hypothetical protein